MKKLSPEQHAKARDIDSGISRRLALLGQLPTSKQLGIDKDAFNRFINNKNGVGITQICQMIVGLGLTVEDIEQRICEPGHSPVPNETLVYMYGTMRQVCSADKISQLEDLLVGVGCIKRNGDGEIVLPAHPSS